MYSSSVPHSAPVSQVIPSCSVNTIIVTDTGDEYHDEVIDVDGDSSAMCTDEFIQQYHWKVSDSTSCTRLMTIEHI